MIDRKDKIPNVCNADYIWRRTDCGWILISTYGGTQGRTQDFLKGRALA